MDIASVIGILIGIFVLFAAQLLQSNSISAILQPTAALIVIGGTLGAILINFSFSAVTSAFVDAKKIFFDENENIEEIIDQLIQMAVISRRDGILGLCEIIPSLQNSFLKRGVQLITDINDTQLIHNLLITEINLEEEQRILSARIFETIGGYTPTFGVVGAVLGLIQVMSNLEDPSQLGHGIATAFVATLYGVGLANLIFLPIAGKLKMNLKKEVIIKEMILQGLISIHLRENPAIIEEKLLTFLNFSRRHNDFFYSNKQNENVV